MRLTHARRGPLAAGAAVALAASAIAALSIDSSATASPTRHEGRLTISSVPWGSVNGDHVRLYTLSNGRGETVRITDYGATIQSMWLKDAHGRSTNVVLGFPKLSDYVNDFMQQHTGTPWPLPGGSGDTYFGATIGRYANRIADHTFTMSCTGCSNNGSTYTLPANNGTNTLHGGDLGWNTKVWRATPMSGRHYVGLRLTLRSADGDMGFPAAMRTTVTYTLDENNALRINYKAKNTEPAGGKATVVNLTNHAYFNLAGEGSGSVNDQLLQIRANTYSPIDTDFILTAPYQLPVAGTPFDFRQLKPIGREITDVAMSDGTSGAYKQLVIAHGYDHNWVLNGSGYRLVSVAKNPGNAITLRTYTDQPGVQFYSGNFLVGDLTGTSGHAYRQTSGFTLETQHFPDTPNHLNQNGWPTVVLKAGKTFASTTTYTLTRDGYAHH